MTRAKCLVSTWAIVVSMIVCILPVIVLILAFVIDKRKLPQLSEISRRASLLTQRSLKIIC